MTHTDLYKLMNKIFEETKAISLSKGQDYTKGSVDALTNFKEGGIEMNIPPEKVCYIFMKKHWAAIVNYIRTEGKSESEPISERIEDLINYLVLLQAIINEKQSGPQS